MAIGDVYQIKASQRVPNVGDEVLNIFFYSHFSGASDLEDVLTEWNLTVGLPMRLCQTQTTTWNYLEISNLYDVTEFARLDFAAGTVKGDYNDDTAPPSTAINFTLQRTSKTVRNGSKRLGGLSNPLVAYGQVTNTGLLEKLQAVAVAFALPIEEPVGGAIFNPVIVGRVKTANPDYPDNSKYPFLYSLPTEPGQSPVVLVKSAKYSPFVSTQVSRKTNR